MRTQEEIATKLKIAESNDTKEKVEHRNVTEERNIKTGNTFSVLHEDEHEPILEEVKLPPITKINKKEKNCLCLCFVSCPKSLKLPSGLTKLYNFEGR